MASHRDPKGVLTRNTPDWLSDNLYFASASDQNDYSNAGSSFATFSLYNDDSLGRALYIYALNVYYDGALGAVYDFHAGTFGTFQAQGRSVRVDQGSGPGQIYLNHSVVSGQPRFTNPDITSPLGTLGGAATGFSISTNFPLFVIPTGWSFRISNAYNSEPNGCTFWYVPLGSN